MSTTSQPRLANIESIQKRDGTIVAFDTAKITSAIYGAARSVGGTDRSKSQQLTDKVIERINLAFAGQVPTVEQVQDTVEKVLIEEGHAQTAKAYILYRAKRAEMREQARSSERAGDVQSAALLDMFAHKSKLARIIGYDRIDSYKNMLFYLKDQQASGALPLHTDYLGGNELATSLYEGKYFMKALDNSLIEKRPEDTFARLAAFMAAVENTPDKQKEWADKFYTSLYKGQFLPGGRVLAGAGDLYRLKTLANCFVSLIKEDNIESIYNAAYECARTYSYGGGIGVDLSVLRPKDSIVHNAATSSTGSVSFMELYSLTTGLIGQSGRRGALMLTLDVKHPDSPYFVEVKKTPNWVTKQVVEQCSWSGEFSEKQLRVIENQVRENTQVRFANISLKVSDEFMQAVAEQTRFGPDKIIIYKKDSSVDNKHARQGSALHYSYGIPSKPIEKYVMLGQFGSLDEANDFLHQHGAVALTKESLDDSANRDIFGDLVVDGRSGEYAVRYAGDFMLYYDSPTTGEVKRLIKARELWNKFVEGNYKTAEPGLIFWSTMSKYSPSNYVGRPIASTNPCGEVPLEDGGACNLGSINLSRFVKNGYTENAEIDWKELNEATQLLVRFLDNVVTWNEILNPLDKQRGAASETRRLGLGVMGIADMLNQLGIAYDSDNGLALIEKVGALIANASYIASAKLAEEKGASSLFHYSEYKECPFFQEALTEETQQLVRQKGLRNIAILSIAPTGTISNVILGYSNGEQNYIGVSGGIEPVFSLYYTRRSESLERKFFKVFHSTVQAYIDQKGLTEQAQSVSDADGLRTIIPAHFFRTAHYIDPSMRVKVQGIFQKYIDHSISSTVNLAEDIEPEVISNIYLDAWQNGLKGITIYRDGSRHPILSVEGKRTAFQDAKEKVYVLDLGSGTKEYRGDDIIVRPDGSLTTVYHALQKGLIKETAQDNGHVDAAEQHSTAAAQDESDVSVDGMVLSQCSECGKNTLKMENGCYTCIDKECGFSKCDI